MKTHSRSFIQTIASACAFIALAFVPARAATMSASSAAPVVNDEDIANYGEPSSGDKWWLGSTSKGQTFTTGGAAVRLKSISYQVADNQQATPTKTYTIRVGKTAGTAFTLVHSENATQNFTWNAGEFMTWTLDTPVLLEPYTTYGIDVGMLTSTTNWNTGIPYINQTADNFPGGALYSASTAGSTLSPAIGSDRIFHLDIERPLDATFALAAVSPVDDATDALANRNIVLTFSQDVTPGTGNLTIHDLTDSTEVQLAANDPRLTFDQNVVRIDPTGLLTWSKDYAIRIDAGMFLGSGGAPISAITDDTTWNFTTLPGDPLLDALAALKNHITGAPPLTGTQIAALKTTIDNNRQRFAENAAIISAVFDLISTYDTKKGPLFVSGSTVTGFDRNNTTLTSVKAVIPENYHWVVYTVMQHAMNVIYTADALAAHKSLLQGFKFGSHTDFPGLCAPPANPLNTHNVAINGSFPATFGRNTNGWTLPARKPTGTYLAPGTIATVTVPSALLNKGCKVRVGAHSWDLSGRGPVERLERASSLYPLDAETIEVASPYGGGIYIEVPIGSTAGVVNVTVTGAVRAPYFSAKSFHQTTPAEWDVEKTHPAPWADFQSEKFMMQVPRTWIYNHPDPAQTMADWDAAMDAIDSLMGFPPDRGKETMYCQVDVIMRASVHAPGYPAVNVTGNPNTNTYSGYRNNYLVRGPNVSLTAANTEFHEQGHAYGFPKFGGESESNVNLLQPAMLNRGFGRTFDEAQIGSFGNGRSFSTIDNTAVAWMTVFNFSPREVPMADAEKAYQLKGHAKFMDIARLFGWEGLDAFWRSFLEDDANDISYATDDDALLLRLSRHVGKDIRPLFHFWGIHPKKPSALAAAIAAENIPASLEIRDLLLRYQTLVPADNTAFRTFAQAWRGKKPTMDGNWEEREHARQWDTAALYGAGDQQRTDATNPGEIYNENSANDIRNRVQELVDLYFPSSITPSPMEFAVAPSAVNATTIGMSATTATAAVGPISYYFENITNGSNSDWIASPTWQQTGLATDQNYSFRVKARDGLLNETAWSQAVVVLLTSSGDVTPPAPSPMAFATPPHAMDETTITMTATTASDVNGVEYYFENTLGGGGNSGWQASPVFTDGELSPNTDYGYRVKARDSQGNETAWSTPAIANTADIPDLNPPQIVSFSPANGALVPNPATHLVVTFDEPVIIGSGFVTLKNLTDGTQSQIDISGSAIAISGNIVTIDPPSNLTAGKTYAVRIDANSVADVSNNPFIGIDDDTTWSFQVTEPVVDYIWDGGGPSPAEWGTATNWVDNKTWSSSASTDVIFHASGAANLSNYTGGNSGSGLTVGRSIGSLMFNSDSDSDVTINVTTTGGASRILHLGSASVAPAITVDPGASGNFTIQGGSTFGVELLNDLTVTHNGNGTLTIASNINKINNTSATYGLTKEGAGTLVLSYVMNSGSNGYTGTTAVNGGTLRLTGALRGGPLAVGGGTFSYNRAAAQTVAGLTVNAGDSLVANTNTGTTNILNFGVITRNSGGIVDFLNASSGSRVITTTTTNTYGILGPWTTVGGDWATQGASDRIVAYTGYTDVGRLTPGTIADGATTNVRIIEGSGSAGDIALGAPETTINTLLQSASGGTSDATIDIAGKTLRTQAIMMAPAAGTLTVGTAANSGTLTAASAGGELILLNKSTNGMTLNSAVADNTSASSLVKSGAGTLNLTGANTYTGATTINGGTLVLTGATQATTSITFGPNSKLGLVIGSPVTAASAAVNLTNGTVTVTGTPSGPSHMLLTAASITGTITLAPAIAGYELQVVGDTELRLVQTSVLSVYGGWASDNAPTGSPDDDYDGDGVSNALEFVLGGLATTSDPGKLPVAATANDNMTFSFVRDHGSVDPSVNLTIEVSSDLIDWSENHTVPDTATTGPPVSVVSGATSDTVTLSLPASGAKKFARLKVVLDP